MALDLASDEIATIYERDGFVVPINVISAVEARVIRDDLEAAEAELAEDPEKLALLRGYPDRLLPSLDALTRHPKLIAAASAVLGPDLMVWSASLFVKEAQTDKIVSWHQDLTYWGLDDAEETTCWVALTTFAEDNLLTRGQEIAVEVDEEDAVVAALEAGQASMHHGHLFHASGPNMTADRRIGSAIRYIKPSMKQQTGDKPLVSLVAGEDKFGHFTVAGPPKGRLDEMDFELCRATLADDHMIAVIGIQAAKIVQDGEAVHGDARSRGFDPSFRQHGCRPSPRVGLGPITGNINDLPCAFDAVHFNHTDRVVDRIANRRSPSADPRAAPGFRVKFLNDIRKSFRRCRIMQYMPSRRHLWESRIRPNHQRDRDAMLRARGDRLMDFRITEGRSDPR